MKYSTKQLDRRLSYIMTAMWVYLTFSAICVFYIVCSMYADPQLAIGRYHTVPLMLECLLGGCAVILGLGVAFEYLGGK